MSINLDSPRLNEAGQILQGGIASLFVNGTVHPICTIKNRLQTRKLNSIKNLVSTKGLYNGYWSIASADIVTFSVAYITNGYFSDKNNNSIIPSILAGLISSPFTAIGEGLMANRQVNEMRYSKVLLRACRLNGLATTAMREIPFTVAVFYTTPVLERHAKKWFEVNDPNNLGIQFGSGALAGASAGFLTTPIDLLKTLVQTSDKPLSMLKAARSVVNNGGWKSLFCGGGARAFYVAGAVTSMNFVNHTLPANMPEIFLKQ